MFVAIFMVIFVAAILLAVAHEYGIISSRLRAQNFKYLKYGNKSETFRGLTPVFFKKSNLSVSYLRQSCLSLQFPLHHLLSVLERLVLACLQDWSVNFGAVSSETCEITKLPVTAVRVIDVSFH